MPDKPATLNAYLKQFREDTRGTADELTQEGIAQKIGESQSQVSKIERGMVRLHTWRPERLYQLLLAWRQTPSMMLQLADRFDLTALREYIAETRHMASVSEGSRVRYLGVVSAGKLGANEVLENGHASVSVPVPEAVIAALGARGKKDELVFRTGAGTPMQQRNVKRALDAGIVKANKEVARMKELGEGLSLEPLPDLRVHDLRRTYATMLAARGVHPRVIQRLLGQSTQATWLIYTDVLAEQVEAARLPSVGVE